MAAWAQPDDARPPEKPKPKPPRYLTNAERIYAELLLDWSHAGCKGPEPRR